MDCPQRGWGDDASPGSSAGVLVVLVERETVSRVVGGSGVMG
jgi:hypothetical protein